MDINTRNQQVTTLQQRKQKERNELMFAWERGATLVDLYRIWYAQRNATFNRSK